MSEVGDLAFDQLILHVLDFDVNKLSRLAGWKPATRKVKTSMKISIGWLHFDIERNKYIQVKLKTGGGSRTVDMPVESSYKEMLEKAINIFFPAGKSPKGRIDKFSCVLGNFTQDLIKEDGFSLQQYTETSCLSNKPRIYLMTKKKTEEELPSLFELLSGDSSDDFDLPDLVYTTQSSPQSLETDHMDQTSTTDSSAISTGTDNGAISTGTDNGAISTGTDSSAISTGTDNGAISIGTESNAIPIGTGSSTISTGTDSSTISTGTDNSAISIGTESNAIPIGTGSSAHAAGTDSSTNATNQILETNPNLNISPVTVRMPRIPTCTICSDRFSDSFLNCGHILCFVCATELTERGSLCHICRQEFTTVSQLYY
ncbi:uncharacterized protein LOC125661328 isoform X1 [Ostrea edulis]|uniref:uncharacterized protein LOC125661328 isoform X1 n=2 Tax=Ostrea edulis TaxID=37623 RepID=UPI002096031F|nr:uncharacterized protein LOC125661328 isoform X1 [Ostrea edulis]